MHEVPPLSHDDIAMIDVSGKQPTLRTAVASVEVRLPADTLDRLIRRDLPKGDVLAAAQIAGIMAAKETSRLLPLCHPLELTKVEVHPLPVAALGCVCIRTMARATARTGVEMEALTAASVAALTVYDMCKGLGLGIEITGLRLLQKTGGRSGVWRGEGVGEVIAVSTSAAKGTPKTNVPEIELQTDRGVKGDAHAGPGVRQVSLLAMESIASAQARGVDVGPGDFAENIATEGLTLHTLPVGTYLRLGSQAVGVVTQIGKECHTPCAIGQALGECVMPTEGIFIGVVAPGIVRPGDVVEVVRDS
jgi:cyclic pyranopterin phosphate synthase